MPKQKSSPLLRYVIAILCSGLALVSTMLLLPIKGQGIFLPFLAAVLISSWLGGTGPGIVAAILSAIAGTFFFLPHSYSLLIQDLGTLLRLIEFMAVATLVISLNAAHRSAQQRVEEAWAEAEVANRHKDQFLAMISHDLRTPLGVILGWVNLLRSKHLDQTGTASALEIIESNALAQKYLINDLMDVSRMAQGRLRLDTHPVDLNCVTRKALEAMQPIAESKNILLEMTMAGEAAIILGDEGRLRRVIWNLLTNAIKFTPKGGRVHVRIERERAQVVLTVSDTGKGITEEFLPYLFDRFRQEERPITEEMGLGLGLSIVRSIVEMHGGTINAESPGEGQGSVFTFRLPLIDAAKRRDRQSTLLGFGEVVRS